MPVLAQKMPDVKRPRKLENLRHARMIERRDYIRGACSNATASSQLHV
jgi:hypothetical protein